MKLAFLKIPIYIALVASGTFAPNKPTDVYSGKIHGHNYRVVVRFGKFDPSKHRIKLNPSAKIQAGKKFPTPTLIDGDPAWGNPDTVPTDEFKAFSVWFDGRRLRFPKRLWSSCYECFASGLNIDFRNGVLVIFAEGGDGYGGYEVTWFIPIKGSPWRRIYAV